MAFMIDRVLVLQGLYFTLTGFEFLYLFKIRVSLC